ncbi:MAG: outer membrane protein assembly factor BamD [Pantoea sp. Brub]|nr:outer membrane protein assembly factor BamD [Pantoea sp. Brub]
MFCKIYLVIIVIFNIMLISCSNINEQINLKQQILAKTNFLNLSFFNKTKDPVDINSRFDVYTAAQENIQHGNFKKAIKQLESLSNLYYSGPYLQQIHLYLIYLYYQTGNSIAANKLIDHFVLLNPNHPNIDYVLYIKILTQMDDNKSSIMDCIKNTIPIYKRPLYTKQIFINILNFLQKYPNSQYAVDARKRLIYLKNILAEHNFYIALFYFKHNAYIASINRINEIIHYYSDSLITYKALKLLEKSYRKLHLYHEADKIAKIIAVNK